MTALAMGGVYVFGFWCGVYFWHKMMKIGLKEAKRKGYLKWQN